MVVKYEYIKSDVNLGKLRLEILDEPSITTTFSHVNFNDPDDLKVFFDSTLSGSEETALDNLVTVHDGTPYDDISGGTWVMEASETSTTSNGWAEKCKLVLGQIPAGYYKIQWSFMWKSNDTETEAIAGFKLDMDGEEIWRVGALTPSKIDEYVPICGITIVNISGIGSHDIKLKYSSAGSQTVFIKDAVIVAEVI